MYYTTNYKTAEDLFSGKLPYQLTNDYLFRAVFQTRPKALEGLCRAILRLKPEDTLSVTLQNPIELGKRIENKEFILDLAIIINNTLFLNMEMQVYQEEFWKERSLSYACRSFDNLNHGDSYNQVLPVVHVGFLNYTLFPEYPEFFATYQLANTSQPDYTYIYSDKLRISVVDLTQIERATLADKANNIDLWARVFTATTWEEIEVLAQNNEYLQEAVSGVRQLTEDEKIRQQCQAREDFAYWERIRNTRLKELGDDLEQTQGQLQQTKDKLLHTESQLQHTESQLQHTESHLQHTESQLQHTESQLQHTESQLQHTESKLQHTEDKLQQTQDELSKALARIAELEGKN